MIEIQYFLLLTVTSYEIPQEGFRNGLDQTRNHTAELPPHSNETDPAFHRYINNVTFKIIIIFYREIRSRLEIRDSFINSQA